MSGTGQGSERTPNWSDLHDSWRVAFGEAWLSFRGGNYGIGAALVDEDLRVVASGRNMVASASNDQRLSGNYMAHAEMNLFAGMSTYDAEGFHLLSTLQPCLMCAATALFLNVGSISYAADDEFFLNLDDLWQHHPYTRPRAVPTTKAFTGPLDSFARLLPLSHTMATLPDSPQAAAARTAQPRLAALAADRDFIEALRSFETPPEAMDFALSRLTP
jgi:tRNA(Arg) A34 adenosine deaminase TadA